MELWIRSQDKNRLTKVDDLYIVHDDNNFCDYIGNNMVGHLAKYTKQGRALEVLDEIQNVLIITGALPEEIKALNIGIKSYFAINIKTGVAIYQMPEK